jgi:hypothetical protein
MPDDFGDVVKSVTAPITNAVAVTPDDDDDLASVARALYVGVSGDVAVIFADGTAAVTLTGLAGGVWHPIRVKRVLATGTDATNIMAGY